MIKPVFIEARDLDDAWFQVIYSIFAYGRKYKIDSGSYEGSYRYSLDFVSGFIRYPHDGRLSPFIPENCPLPPPTTDEKIREYFTNYILDSKLNPDEDYRYSIWIVGGEYEIPPISGKYIGSNIDQPKYKVKVPNQLSWIVDHFNKKGLYNEHCYITIGYPESNFAYDIPYSNPNERKTSPCLRGLDFRVINDEGKDYLFLHVIYRSWDAVGGFPVNMGAFTLLNQAVALQIGVEPGPLAFSCKSLHAYDFHYDYIKARLAR